MVGGKIELKLRDVGHMGYCPVEDRPSVTREMTPEVCAEYDRLGWHTFREEDLIEHPLPEISPPIYFSGRHSLSPGTPGIVVGLGGRRFRVHFREEEYPGREHWECEGKTLILEETTDPLTKPDGGKTGNRRGGHYYKFFGQPMWVQNEYFPLGTRGQLCSHFLTIENEWGDMGNYNILVSLGEDGVPDAALFEASCC
jgi:hypothetical protein